MLTLKIIFNKLFLSPSLRKKIFLLFFFLLVPLSTFAKVKKIKWGDQHWTFYINPHHYFLILGSWDEPLVVDHPVNDMWGEGSDFGLCVVYQKGIEFRWLVLNPDTGDKLLGGVLFYMGPDTGYVSWIQMARVSDGFTVKVAFDTGTYMVYKIDSHGNKTVLKQGKWK
jgi:hypothetical protein